MKKFKNLLLFAMLFMASLFLPNTGNAQVLPSEGDMTVIGTGSTPSLITGADTVYAKCTVQGTGNVTMSLSLEATGTSPTITGVITLWCSLDGVFYFPHPTGGDATTTLTAQSPTAVPSANTLATNSVYTKLWGWTTDNPYKYYMIRIIATSLGGTSPTFNVSSARYLVRKKSGNI